jgi:hypothetical protein
MQSGERDGPSWYFEYEIGTKYVGGKGARERISEAAYKVSCSFVEEETVKGGYSI